MRVLMNCMPSPHQRYKAASQPRTWPWIRGPQGSLLLIHKHTRGCPQSAGRNGGSPFCRWAPIILGQSGEGSCLPLRCDKGTQPAARSCTKRCGTQRRPLNPPLVYHFGAARHGNVGSDQGVSDYLVLANSTSEYWSKALMATITSV